MNKSKINKFLLILNAVGFNINAVYAELIYTIAIKNHEDTIELKDVENLHNSITDQKITQASKLIEKKIEEGIPEDKDKFIQELAQLFIGDVKI